MINSKDLRIGNYVWGVSDRRVKIAALGVNFCTVGMPTINQQDTEAYTDISGIVLTPEILEKCGARKRGEDEGDIWYLLEIGFCFGHRIYISGNFYNGLFVSFGEPQIKYLHQIQNLYFSLTNTELTINI